MLITLEGYTKKNITKHLLCCGGDVATLPLFQLKERKE